MDSKTSKIIQLSQMKLVNLSPRQLIAAQGTHDFTPTPELLALFGKLLGDEQPMTMHRFNKLFDGKNTLSVSEARLFSWYFDISIDALCQLDKDSGEETVGNFDLERQKIA